MTPIVPRESPNSQNSPAPEKRPARVKLNKTEIRLLAKHREMERRNEARAQQGLRPFCLRQCDFAEDLGVSVRSVMRASQTLDRLGLVTRVASSLRVSAVSGSLGAVWLTVRRLATVGLMCEVSGWEFLGAPRRSIALLPSP
jgi:hypothetical protein